MGQIRKGALSARLYCGLAGVVAGVVDDGGDGERGGVGDGHMDGDLVRLWDGIRVRLVDFEDSGLSDRAFELAVLVEHISAWSGAGLSAEAFLALFNLTVAEQVTFLAAGLARYR